jgi:hypothetical protein
MHFGAEVYKTIEERERLSEQYGNEWPGLIIARDDMTVDI